MTGLDLIVTKGVVEAVQNQVMCFDPEGLYRKMLFFVVIQLHVRWLFEDSSCTVGHNIVYIDFCTNILYGFFLKQHDGWRCKMQVQRPACVK